MLRRILRGCCAVRTSRKLTFGLLLGLTVIVGRVGQADKLLAENVRKASTSREAKESAIQSIPFEKLSRADRARVVKLIQTRSIYRRLPIHVAQCDPQFYEFCLNNPDLVVNIWRVFDITDLEMKKVDENKYQGRDEEGTEGTVEFLYHDHEKTIIFIEGKYDGPFTPKSVSGRALLVLRSGFVRDTDGKYYATSRLDSFTQVDNVAIDFFARTLQPLLGKIADNNFVQTSAFIGSLSRTAEANPDGVKGLSEELTYIDGATCAEFAELVDGVASRATRQASYEASLSRPLR